MKKEKIFVVSAGVTLGIACVSSCFAPPMDVHADFGNLSGAVDFITGATGTEAEGLLDSPVAGWLCMLYVFQQFYYDYEYDIASNNGMSLQEMSGLYVNELGEEKIAVLCLTDSWTNPSTVEFWCPVLYSDDFGLSVIVPGGGSCNISYDGSSSPARLNLYGSSGLLLHSNSETYLAGSVSGDSVGIQARPFFANQDSYLYGTGLASRFKKWAVNANTTFTLKNAYPVAYELPPSDNMTFADIDAYLQGDFRNYVIQYYPEYIYLIPDPPVLPSVTLDPSETMPGLPVIQLPTVPPPEYDMELPEKMLEGAGFWFTALTEVLDEMGWLAIVIALAVIAIVLYYVF